MPQADFVVACGTLNYRSADPAFVFDSIDPKTGSCRPVIGR